MLLGPAQRSCRRALTALGIVAAVAVSARGAAQTTVWDGVYTQAQAKRGEAAYLKDCASCHKEHLLGDDDYANPLIGPLFLGRWNNKSVGDLYEKNKMTMPANSPDTLKPQEYVDITAYLLSTSEFPAGQRELPPDLAQLKLITSLAARPK
jgi:mono/diheme cytochrome c family protein